MLRILLLGTPVVSLDEVDYPISRRLQRAMLFYLAARGSPVGREELIGLFWPEEDDEKAHRHLREALSKLRAELPERDLLITNTHQVSLDFKKVYVDSLEFTTLLRQGGLLPWQQADGIPLPENIARMLMRAVLLWRTPYFMAGSDFSRIAGLENWYSLARQELERQRQHLLIRLADHSAAQGDLEMELHWLLRAILYDEVNEDLNGRILSLYIDLGQRQQAKNFFIHLKQLYEQGEKIAFPQAVLKIYNRMQLPGEEPRPGEWLGWPASQRLHPPLVGRHTLLRDLRQAYQRGGVVILLGEAGVGKSRVAGEFYHSLEPSPYLLLASAHPMETNLPFQAIIEMLRRYVTADDWNKLSPTWGRQLASLLPELTVICPKIEFSSPQQPEQAQSLLFEAVRQILILLSQKQRLFIFLDDAQWADEASLSALGYLLERGFFNRTGFLVIAARLEEVNHNLETTFNIARRAAPCYEISLPLLAKPEILELAGYALGQVPSDALLDALAKDTGGNPLFIILTANALLEMESYPHLIQVSNPLPLASGIHILLHGRLRRASPQARQTALTAAIIGNTFEVNVLEQATHVSEDHLAQALDELENLQLIQMVQTLPGSRVTYAFIHDKIREVMLLQLSPARKRLLHRQVAGALAASLGGRAIEQAAVLAQHYESAGDLILAYDWWLKAAQRANQLLSIKEAETAFKRAELILQNQTGELDDERVYQLYSKWGEMIYETYGEEKLERIYTTLLRLGEQRQSSLLIGTALSGLCAAVLNADDLNKGLDYAEQAMTYLQLAGNTIELAQLYNRLGLAFSARDRIKEARSAFEKALELSINSQEPAGQQAYATAQHEIAWILFLTGWPEQAIEYAQKALKESRFFLRQYNQMRFYNALILPNVFIGNYAGAHENALKGIELAQKLQSWRYLNYLQVFSSQCELVSGNLDACLENIANATELDQQYHIGATQPDIYERIGTIYLTLGSFEKAQSLYQHGLEVGHGATDFAELKRCLGLCLGITGEVERGLSMIEEAIALSEACDYGYISIPAHMSLGLLYLNIGEKEKARGEANFVCAEGQRRGFYFEPLMAKCILANLALVEGDTVAARRYAQAMINQPGESANIFVEIQGLILLLEALRREKQSDPEKMQRLILCLDKIEAHTQHPDIAPLVQKFRENVLSSVQ